MKIIGYGVIVTAVALGVAAALAATWFFLVGGILDLADGRTIAGGLGRIDEWNREYADRWGRTRLGLLKVFVLAPIALVIIALAVRVLLSLGRRLAGSAPKPEAPAPQATEPAGQFRPSRKRRSQSPNSLPLQRSGITLRTGMSPDSRRL